MPKLEKFFWDVGFPVYCAGFNASGELLIGGGGGAGRTGVKNKLVLYKVEFSKSNLIQLSEIELSSDEDTPVGMGFHPEYNIVVCGINSKKEKIQAGENENCRLFKYSNKKINLVKKLKTLSSTNPNDYQKVSVFSKDGRFLATGGTDSKLTVLKYPSLDLAFPPMTYDQDEIYDIDFDTSGKNVVAVSSNHLRVWSTRNGKCIQTIDRPVFQKSTKCEFRAVRYGRETSEGFLYTVVNTTSRSKAYIVKWNLVNWDQVTSKAVSQRPIVSFTISKNGKLLAFASSDLSVRILDSQNLRVLSKVSNVHQFPALTLNFSHDSALLVSGSFDNTVNIIKIPKEFGSVLLYIILVLISVLVLVVGIIVQLYLAKL
ncbi:hypothetical protein G9A89_010810 [Geosiphon pyriformis]|nr:hypothetical protein G9A89_010810 [Geosiphon pyriformis]